MYRDVDNMTNVKVIRNNVLNEEEVKMMINKADEEKHIYLKLRAKCLVAIARRTGKRAGELNMILFKDVKVQENGDIDLVFTLEKKRKKEVIQKKSPPKTILHDDPYRQYIVDYLDLIKRKFPEDPIYLFPNITYYFGNISIDLSKHITRQTVHNIIKRLNKNCWTHLFRESVGAEIIQRDPSIFAPFKVQRRLDLEDINSAFRYMRRYAKDVIEHEERKVKVNS